MKIQIKHTKTYGMQKVIRVKFIAANAHIVEQEKPQINNLTLHLTELEKDKQIKPTVRRKK